MKRLILVLGLLAACGGQAEAVPTNAPDGGTAPADAAAPEPERPSIPLCPGAAPPKPGDCQTLVYDLVSGYCNRWEACAP